MTLLPPMVALTLGYLCSDPYCRSRVATGVPMDPTAHCLRWGDTAVEFNQSTLGNPATGEAAFVAADKAWATWQAAATACTELVVYDGPRSTSRFVGFLTDGGANENLVLFRTQQCSAPQTDPCWNDGDCNNVYDCWSYQTGTIALTTTTYDTTSGFIYDADIELNAANFVFTAVDSPPCLANAQSQSCVATDIQNTLTHETGHALGLDHNTSPTSTMFNSAPLGETSKRVLDPGSKQFLCDVYTPVGPPRDCVLTPAPSGSCSAPGDAASAAPSLALGALGVLGLARGRTRRAKR